MNTERLAKETAAAEAATDGVVESLLRESETTGRTAGRNDPCPCGSGKKYKKCCMQMRSFSQGAFPVGRTMPSDTSTASPLYASAAKYLEEAEAWSRGLNGRGSMQDALAQWDKAYNHLTPQNYSVVISEMLEREWPLLLLEDPDFGSDFFGAAGDTAKLKAMVPDMVRRYKKGYGQRAIADIDLKTQVDGRLWDALVSREHTFDVGAWEGEFPFITFQKQSAEVSDACAAVASILTYSARLNDCIAMPIMTFKNPDRQEFESSLTFVHELVHVLQRVFRKKRIPTYFYRDPNQGQLRTRNMEHLIAVGIVDELEVQAIMRRVYPSNAVSLGATLSYIECVKRDLTDLTSEGLDADYARQTVAAALKLIDFEKYQPLTTENLEKTIRSAFGQL